MTAFAQVEDTLHIGDLFGTGLFLNQLMANDTAGTGPKGAAGATAWQNKTRVYILEKNGFYPYNGQFNVRNDRKLVIRGENANYTIPAHGGNFRPLIFGYPVAGIPPGRFVNLNQPNDTLILKNLAICGIDESSAGNLDKNQGNMIEIQSTGANSSIFIDSCVLKTVSGQIMQIGASGAVHANTIKITNTIFADMGFIGNSNLGAGRGIDLRNSEIDTVIVENCTFINWQDRVVRHYLSSLPIRSFKFNHNTLINGMSYHGMISLGLIDSLGNGPFEITNNLFVDNFAMGPDSDAVRQSEFTDSPDIDSRNSTFKASWFVTRVNTTAHNTPWNIANNYYVISDSGVALRSLATPYLYTPNWNVVPEPILTSDMWRQLKANGKDSATAFQKVSLTLTKVPALMSKMIKWYYTVEGAGTGGATINNVGAGAGRKKTGTNNTPATNFIHDVTANVWVYDYNRATSEWYMDSLDAAYSTSSAAYTGAFGGYPAGDLNWFPARKAEWLVNLISGTGGQSSTLPSEFALEQNYPNPFNPATKITYSVPQQGAVLLEVFDLLGRRVATLVNENRPAGTFTVEFDGSKLVSGLYIYRLSTSQHVFAKKMLLIK